VDRIELIGSAQFHLPVGRANSGLMPGEVVFQPHHVDAGGFVNRRLIRLAEEGRIILSGPMSSAEAEAAARHEFNVARYHRRMLSAVERLPGSGTTSSSGSADEFVRMVETSNRGSLPLGFQGNIVLHCMSVAYGRVGPTSCESSPFGGQSLVSVADLTGMCSFSVGQISTLGEDLPGRVDGHIELSATEREGTLQSATCDALSPGSFEF